MMQLREIRVTGIGVEDAFVTFGPGANILAGASDTGKSYIVKCLDYIFGADAMVKRPKEAEPYSQVMAEFENATGDFVTLVRDLSGGALAEHRCRIREIQGTGRNILARRHGKSTADDVTSSLLALAGMGMLSYVSRPSDDNKNSQEAKTNNLEQLSDLVDQAAMIAALKYEEKEGRNCIYYYSFI